jgi:hypothetical protein
MQSLGISPQVREAIRGQESKLAAIEIPKQVDAAQGREVKRAIGESFVAGFRLVMAIGVALALLSAGFAWLTLDGGRQARRRAR